MTCTSPIKSWVKVGDTTVPGPMVPCGHCLACRIAKTEEWSIRLLQEAQYWDRKGFVTLTYADEWLPYDGGIHKTELQLWFKRLRKALDGRAIKYFACGEYGDRNGRPHYHAIIFGVDKEDYDVIKTTWGKGRISVDPVSYYDIRYVAGYVFKKYNGDRKLAVYKDKESPWQLQSQGIGGRWLVDNKAYVMQDYTITINGIRRALPRYYMRKLKESGDINYDYLESKMVINSIKYHDALAKDGVADLEQARKELEIREKKKNELIFRMEKKKKKKL